MDLETPRKYVKQLTLKKWACFEIKNCITGKVYIPSEH